MGEQGAAGGHLVIIGGGEDRKRDRSILSRFVELAGGPDKKIVVISAASTVGGEVWAEYNQAFGALGVERRRHLHVETREQAGAPDMIEAIGEADGIFITGGDQKRLLALIGGSPMDGALHAAYKVRGACIGGTSAGASAMCGHMLAQGHTGPHPEKGGVSLGAGLGLLHRVVIDQHFSQRHRLPRLLTVVAQNPYLQGIGIDENTALVIERGASVEVMGEGAVTVIDGRAMSTNVAEIDDHATPRMVDVRLHLLPAGSRFALGEDGAADGTPPALLDFVLSVTRPVGLN